MDTDTLRGLAEPYLVTAGEGFRLDRCPTRYDGEALDKEQAAPLLAGAVRRLSRLQETLYADGRWSVLMIVQAMDAAGKDGTIKHVLSGVNPQGVAVTSFKAPGAEDLAHGFLWRIGKALPARGMIGVFNRSHYEEVLVARVRPGILAAQGLPPELTGGARFWDERLADIAAFERYVARQGTRILKVFLHVSREEQRKRLLARLETPGKLWKFDPRDLADRDDWDAYMQAYQAAIAATASPDAPWLVVPADQKWFARLVVASALCAVLEALPIQAPEPSAAQRESLAQAKAALGRTGDGA